MDTSSEVSLITNESNEHDNDQMPALMASNVPSNNLPVISFLSGLRSKANPYSLQPWAALSLTLDGRDSITKIFQYSSRLLVFCFSRAGLMTEAMRFDALQSSLTLSRKAFRLGRSLAEIEKLRGMGAFASIMWHIRRANCVVAPQNSGDATVSATLPLWKTLGSALKVVGLIAFWAGDNTSFLASAGVLDDFTLPELERTSQRVAIQKKAATFANRSYLFGCLAGLFVAVKSYWLHRMNDLRIAQEQVIEARSNDKSKVETAIKSLEKAQREQFMLFLSVVKGTCDAIVFGNNTGVDLFTKINGEKNHEILHCAFGILSASIALCSNFPDKNVKL